jgi:hypothetical protein
MLDDERHEDDRCSRQEFPNAEASTHEEVLGAIH